MSHSHDSNTVNPLIIDSHDDANEHALRSHLHVCCRGSKRKLSAKGRRRGSRLGARPASPSQRWAEPKPLGKHQPPVRERAHVFSSISADLLPPDTCGCVSDAAAGEQTQESEEATVAAAVVRSHSFVIGVVKTVRLTSNSALQESKAEDGGDSAGEF